MAGPTPDSGSFRDPLSRVFVGDGRVVRAFTAAGAADIDAVWRKSSIQDALASGTLIESRIVTPAKAGLGEPWKKAMTHPRLPFVSYPHEWTFSMLKDAALLQLALIRSTLADGVAVKDATPYNVQFVGSRPVFIDAGSFEPRRKGDPWYGYLQFCQMYLYPLMLQAHREVPFQPFLRGQINGITPDTMRKLLPGSIRRPRRGRFTHVVLLAAAQARFASTEVDVRKAAAKAGMNAKVLDATLSKLEKIVSGLETRESSSTWSGYSERGHYLESSLDEKEKFVRDAVKSAPRAQVWDVGCNDGRFSRIAARHAKSVVSMDADHLVVDRLYRELRAEKNDRILPLVVDMSDAGGGIGWRGRERPGILDRGAPDMVLYLAVVHHMAITYNIPLAAQVDMLADLSGEIVIEFPHENDPMVRTLLRNKREGTHDDYTLAGFERVLAGRFKVVRRETLAGGTRTIFHAARKGASRRSAR